jgi:1,2-diacylglycerol 3-alpha-glucosyltransferase
MRLLIAGSTYPPQINGQSVFTGSLASSMAAAGHDVMVMTPSEIGQSYRSFENGVLHWAVRSIDLSFIHRDFFIAVAYCGMVNDALETFQPDVIHLQDSAPLNQYILRAARKRGIPVMITHHIGPAVGAPYFTWFTDLLGGRMIGLVWKWVIAFLNQADVLTAPSRAAAEMLRRHRVTPPVWPISCGVPIDQFEPTSSSARAALREQWGLPQDRTVFLYVGRLDWEKRPEVLLNAMARLAPDQAYLVLAGTGAAERELRAVAKRLQLGERIRFLGDIKHERVSSLFEACDIFIMPGDVESLSIATLEAMACGKPVLAANAMALPELVQPGLNGQLFKPRSSEDAATKMEWFINQPNQWKRMGQASRERAASHSIPAVMRKFEALYRETAAQRIRTVKPTRATAQWSPQRLLPHLKALFLLAFLFLSSVMVYSDTTAAPHILLETLDTFKLENTEHLSPLLPPASLTDPAHTWLNSPLDQNQVQKKLKAIGAFLLETNRIRWALTSFARPNEIFSPLTICRMPFNLPEHLPENRSRNFLEGMPDMRSEWFLDDPG